MRQVVLALACWAMLVAPVAAAPPFQEGQIVHVVAAGETLYWIAERYGVTVDALVAANGISDAHWIEVGQRLVIPASDKQGPAAGSFAYTVQPGDTVALIARRYGIGTDLLTQANRLTNPNLIFVGQILVVPVAVEEVAVSRGKVHVVEAGDTLARIGARYGVSVWAIAQLNAIANPSLIYVGQRLLIPSGEGASSLPSPFVDLTLVPVVAAQGQTVQLAVEIHGEADVSGQFDGRALLFVGTGGRYRTLIGIHPMASPGAYALDLLARQGGRETSVRSMVYVTSGSFGVQYLTFSAEKAKLLDPKLVAAEAERVHATMTEVTLPGVWQGPFSMPLAEEHAITSAFGMRRSYDGGPATSYHGGVDYDAAEGTPVLCTAPGRVVLAEPLQVRGNAVIVDHGRGVMTGFWHLSEIGVEVGQSVSTGDVLGRVGNTGLSTGAHLHWEMRVMGVQVDPLQWVRESIQ
ncbi:MAG: LysM peptidoglycan-binding domain-containing M23 family metallopeptidase [Anaerolineae bacterium]|nr:LysM peptidoglycan-binding domain-containing M23 family metallopeptidase [Anaerolineae bacterium]